MRSQNNNTNDSKTADAFANSWNNLPEGSVYTHEQFTDWFEPLSKNDIYNKNVLELGCGNGSLMVHVTLWQPAELTGVDLGDSVVSCEKNLQQTEYKNYKIIKNDLTTYQSKQNYDVVYCIGVLHHLKHPLDGLKSVINNTKQGGKFHCWVYAKEGNFIIRYIVDPIRIISSRLPWWFTKYFTATILVTPYFFYAKLISKFKFTKHLPLYEYSCWIAKRNFAFFRHVAFDQLVTPQTTYISKSQIENWLTTFSEIDAASVYIIFRNGNSWKFGGIKK
jgi:SAM-dependent methyltransferase